MGSACGGDRWYASAQRRAGALGLRAHVDNERLDELFELPGQADVAGQPEVADLVVGTVIDIGSHDLPFATLAKVEHDIDATSV